MSGSITLVGRLTADPELRFTPSGAAVTKFTVVTADRRKNQQTDQWEDTNTSFHNCEIWRQAAENVAESLQKGTQVIVVGKLVQRSYEKDGEKRTVWDVKVDHVGPSLQWATAKVAKMERSGGTARPTETLDDPWAN